MRKELIDRIVSYLQDGLRIQEYSGQHPHCECCNKVVGYGHSENCELNNILKELESEG